LDYANVWAETIRQADQYETNRKPLLKSTVVNQKQKSKNPSDSNSENIQGELDHIDRNMKYFRCQQPSYYTETCMVYDEQQHLSCHH